MQTYLKPHLEHATGHSCPCKLLKIPALIQLHSRWSILLDKPLLPSSTFSAKYWILSSLHVHILQFSSAFHRISVRTFCLKLWLEKKFLACLLYYQTTIPTSGEEIQAPVNTFPCPLISVLFPDNTTLETGGWLRGVFGSGSELFKHDLFLSLSHSHQPNCILALLFICRHLFESWTLLHSCGYRAEGKAKYFCFNLYSLLLLVDAQWH